MGAPWLGPRRGRRRPAPRPRVARAERLGHWRYMERRRGAGAVGETRAPCRALGTGAARGRRLGRRRRPRRGPSPKESPMFDTLEMSVAVMEVLGPIDTKIRAKRKSLADEIGRAGESIALNVSEGRKRAGLDRPDFYRRAAGSADELTTALRIARI